MAQNTNMACGGTALSPEDCMELTTQATSDEDASACEMTQDVPEPHGVLHTSSVQGLKRLRSVNFFANSELEPTGQSPTKRFGLEVEVSSPGSWVAETGFDAGESPRFLESFYTQRGEGFHTEQGAATFGGFANREAGFGVLASPATDVDPESSAVSCEFDLRPTENVDTRSSGLVHLTCQAVVLDGGHPSDMASAQGSPEESALEIGAEPLWRGSTGVTDLASAEFETASEGSCEEEQGLGFRELDSLTGGVEEQSRRVGRIEALIAQEVLREAEMIEARIALESGLALESIPHVDIATWLRGTGSQPTAESEVELSEVGSSIGNTSMAVFRGDLNSHVGSAFGEDDDHSDTNLEGEGMNAIPENVGAPNELVGFELAPTGFVENPDPSLEGLTWVVSDGTRVVSGGVRMRRRTREEEEQPLLAQPSPRSEGGMSSLLESYPQLDYMDQLEEAQASEQLEEILSGYWDPAQGVGVLVSEADTEIDAHMTDLEWGAFLREALLGAWRWEGLAQGLEEDLAQGLEELAQEDETLRRFGLLNPGEMVNALADPSLVARLETRAERGLYIQGTRAPILQHEGLAAWEEDDVIFSENDDASEGDESEVAHDDVMEEYGAFEGASEVPESSGGLEIAHQQDPTQDCSICYRPLEAEPVIALRCGHEYHGTCVKKWLKSGAPNALSCPFCRGKIRRTPALEELLPNANASRLRRSPSESTIDLHDERGIGREDLLHEVRQWPDAERLIVSGIGVETVLQVLNEAQAEIRIIELYGTGEDRVAEEERFWYRMRGNAFPPLPAEAVVNPGLAAEVNDLNPAQGSAAVQRLLLHNGEMRSGPLDNPLQSAANPPVDPSESSFTAFLRRVFSQLPNLVDFSAPACGPELRPASLAWLAHCCPKVRLIRLGWCSFPDLGSGVISLAEGLGARLEELEILGPLLDLDALDALILHCRRLRVLNITRSNQEGLEHTDFFDEAFARLTQLNPSLRIEVIQGSPDYVSF